MKRFLLTFFYFHFIPIIVGTCCCIFILYLFDLQLKEEHSSTNTIKGQQLMFRGVNSNFDLGNQAEIEFCGSLSNPNYITLMGSSELADLKYTPYYYLPDSLHTPVVGFGHAHHQSFVMFCELLAMQRYLNKSKICILISPSWFEEEGTNIEAFLEFVRPNFLKSIVNNKKISFADKIKIGKYISENYKLIDNPSKSILYFKNLYFLNQFPILESITKKLNSNIKDIKYQVKLSKNTLPKRVNINSDLTKKRLKKNFINSIKSNNLFVNDDYYTRYLLNKQKISKKEFAKFLNPSENREFADFKLLIQLLKNNNCHASFIIQPLNPYYYKDLNVFNEILDSIKICIEKNNFTYLDMFVTDQKKYDTGILNDVMHLGDYGWMKVNDFIINTYKIENDNK